MRKIRIQKNITDVGPRKKYYRYGAISYDSHVSIKNLVPTAG